MSIVAFDTLAYSNRLEKNGFTREQAEAVANANAEALRDMLVTQELATRKDLAEVKAELQKSLAETKAELEKSIAETKAELQQQLAETKHDLLKWIIGIGIGGTSLIIAAMGLGIALLK